ncbi:MULTISPECIES: hypothetical protein [unclassified Mesorhizobium]|uniref:hypothetical protein n=1 Tax=unclassified Mesorhizobium TaxID=325217 RepID=UPI000FC9DA57|nr:MULTISPECIES: hypothetical protein [unclassified Mesorhizobium]TIT72489.1 MAG: hypothetical protein E5W57_29835 [Mesorhizobium sp.]TGP20280.1 hypothetical protein EN874_026230 [Mesorhizobium sp. M1D.F.Ca.ET.231.01.1.1]TGP27757.1 hypothetical protein EN877_25520 [Mesorhizobium sp. M1D.F.Ca.ET.234.01.1.1]TGS42107.1 hypothetical protein EN827_24605 [Mesorhizobium sp. M1D.F.Ca.ET.184.01.1.1]TGS59459.1 hypothetical protein EN826_024605 [Mesorhizobium sp. M1D.F.Ca.ET.183.01.1.1]
MKVVLSALVLTLALSPAVEAKTKTLVSETKINVEKKRPPLDQTSTGGIALAGTTTAPQGDPGQAYPPALDLHF